FRECHFEQCNFTNTNVSGVAFQEVQFSGCKLLGIDFHDIRPMRLDMFFRETRLELCLFHGLNLSDTSFLKCEIIESEFMDTNLSQADFTESDLSRSRFRNANLQKAQFQTARNYRINPTENELKGARFSRMEIEGLLKDFGILLE
ncbi:MAG: pentapeptide repeat-containing protein, partial [Bacteroidetes bacterium]|nr:pentapeptide repeat-containing protein [Bacteroidota bacterium]